MRQVKVGNEMRTGEREWGNEGVDVDGRTMGRVEIKEVEIEGR